MLCERNDERMITYNVNFQVILGSSRVYSQKYRILQRSNETEWYDIHFCAGMFLLIVEISNKSSTFASPFIRNRL